MGQGALLTAHVNPRLSANQRPVLLSIDHPEASIDQSEESKHPLYPALDSSMCGSDTRPGGWGQWSDPDGAFNIFDAFKSRSLPDNTTIIIPDAALSKTLLIHFLFSRCIKHCLTIVYSALSRITPPNINLRIFFISACIIISFLKQFMQKNLHPSAPRYLPRSLEILRIHPASALCMGPLLCEYNPESHDWMDIRLMTGWMSELPV